MSSNVLVNLEKISDDIVNGSRNVQTAALQAVLHFSTDSALSSEGIASLLKIVEKIQESTDGDVLFLARKAQNHLTDILSPASTPSTNFTEQTREACLQILETSDDALEVSQALSALLKKGEAADVDGISAFISHNDSRVRSNAIEFIERYGTDDQVVAASMKLLSDDNNRVRGTVLSVLGRLKPSVVTPHFKVMLESEQISVRESAVYALSRIKGEWVVRLLIKAMSDSFEGIRMRAAEALGRQRDVKALEALTKHLDDVSPDVVQAVENSIEFLSMEEVQGLRSGELKCTDSYEDVAVNNDFEQQFAHEMTIVQSLEPEALKELEETGSEVYRRVMDKEISSESLELIFCDIVKLEEFKKEHSRQLKSASKRTFDGLRIIVGRKLRPEKESAERLKTALSTRYLVLALVAVRDFNRKVFPLSDTDPLKEQLVRIMKWGASSDLE